MGNLELLEVPAILFLESADVGHIEDLAGFSSFLFLRENDFFHFSLEMIY